MAGYESFHIAPEASIPYKITGEDGTVAVLNDPADPNFVGYLDGEDALSGIDSPEIRDSFAEMSEQDGSWAGQSFYTRRPIVMNGRVIPTSAADRNAKLGRLMRACTARFSDGILEWTPSGSNGEPVFLRFRTQLPFRAKGGFNKQFQIGLVANDPRIYTKRIYSTLNTTVPEDNGHSHFKLTGGTVGSPRLQQELILPAGTWDVRLPVCPDTAGGTAQLTVSGTGVTAVTNPTTALTPANEWMLVELQFTIPASTTVTVQLRSSSSTTYVSDIQYSSIQAVDDYLYFSVPQAQYVPVRLGTATLTGQSQLGVVSRPMGPIAHPANAFNPGTVAAPLSFDVMAPANMLYVVHHPDEPIYIAMSDTPYGTPGWFVRPDWVSVPNTRRAYVRNSSGNSRVDKVWPTGAEWSGVRPSIGRVFIHDFAGSGTDGIDGLDKTHGTYLCARWRGTFL